MSPSSKDRRKESDKKKRQDARATEPPFSRRSQSGLVEGLLSLSFARLAREDLTALALRMVVERVALDVGIPREKVPVLSRLEEQTYMLTEFEIGRHPITKKQLSPIVENTIWSVGYLLGNHKGEISDDGCAKLQQLMPMLEELRNGLAIASDNELFDFDAGFIRNARNINLNHFRAVIGDDAVVVRYITTFEGIIDIVTSARDKDKPQIH